MAPLPLFLSVQVVLWHGYSAGGEERALEEVVRRWNRAQERLPQPIRVEAVGIPFGSMADKLRAAVPRGHGPDLFIFPHDAVGEWARSGLLAPLEELLPLSAVLPELDLLPASLLPLRQGGHLFGLPLSTKGLVLFYRTDLVPQPPATTDELLALCRGFRPGRPGPGPGPRRYGLAYEAASYYYHAVWLHGFGGAIFPPGSALPRLHTPEQARALGFLRDLVRAHDIPEEPTAVLVAQLFNEGRAATVINGPWFVGQIEPGVPYGVAPLPRVSATGLPAAPLTTIETGYVSRYSSRQPQAAAFLRYLAGPESALLRARLGGQAVTGRAAWQDPAVRADPVLRAMHAQQEHMVPMDTRPEMRAFWEAGQFALRQAMRGASDPERALALGQRQLDLFLKPLPPPARRTPYLLMLSSLLLLGALGTVRRARPASVYRQALRERGAYAYLLPAALAMTVLVFVPFAVGAGMSLYAADVDGSFRFVGVRNFADILLLREARFFEPLSFYYTLLVTLLWTVLNVALHVLLGGSLALLLRDPLLRLRGVYRMLLLLPWAVPNYITALIWKGMFNQQFGAINGILVWLGLRPVAWFSSFATALAANVATNVWLGFPFFMVVILGNLAQLPQEVEEAATLDGATRLQRLRHIVLPLLLPALLPSVLLGAVWTFNMFNIVYLVSGGEPDGATDILVSQAYRWAFTRGHRYGYAAAYAVLIFVVLLFQSALLRRVSDRSER